MDAGAWIALASLAVFVLVTAITAIINQVSYRGSVDRRITEIHERKVALTKRVDSAEKNINDMRHDIANVIKEGFAEVKAELKGFRDELAKKQDKP